MKLLAIPVLVLGLSACNGFLEGDSASVVAAKIVTLKCDTLATAADEATPLVEDGTFNDSQLERLERAADAADLVCQPDAEIDVVEGVDLADAALESFNRLLEAF